MLERSCINPCGIVIARGPGQGSQAGDPGRTVVYAAHQFQYNTVVLFAGGWQLAALKMLAGYIAVQHIELGSKVHQVVGAVVGLGCQGIEQLILSQVSGL